MKKKFNVTYGYKSLKGFEGSKIMSFESLRSARIILENRYPELKFKITEVNE